MSTSSTVLGHRVARSHLAVSVLQGRIQMRKLKLVRLIPGRFDKQMLSSSNTTRLEIDENNVVHAVMRDTGDHWGLFGVVDAVQFDESEQPRPLVNAKR